MKFTVLTAITFLISLPALADKERAIARYNKFLNSIKPGTSFEVQNTGNNYEIIKEGPAFQASLQKVNTLEKSIVLKKEEGRVYQYVEFKDLVNPEKSYRRVLMSKSILEIVPAILNIPDTVIGTKRATIVLTNEGYLQKETATIEKTSHLKIDLDVRRYCDTRIETTLKDVIFAYNGSRTPLTSASNLWVMSCGEEVSLDALKKIDLSSIELCKETDISEEPECERKADLNFLLHSETP